MCRAWIRDLLRGQKATWRDRSGVCGDKGSRNPDRVTQSRGEEKMVRLEKWELRGLAKEQSESRERCEHRLLTHPEHKWADYPLVSPPVHVLVKNDLEASPDSRGHS